MPSIVLSIMACTTPLNPLPNDPQIVRSANLLPNSLFVYQVPIKNTICFQKKINNSPMYDIN